MGDYPAIGVVFALALARGDGQSGKTQLFNLSRDTESDIVKQSVGGAVMLEIDVRRRVFDSGKHGV